MKSLAKRACLVLVATPASVALGNSDIHLTYSNPGGVSSRLSGGEFVAVTVMDQSGIKPTRASGGEFESIPPAEKVIEEIVDSCVQFWLNY